MRGGLGAAPVRVDCRPIAANETLADSVFYIRGGIGGAPQQAVVAFIFGEPEIGRVRTLAGVQPSPAVLRFIDFDDAGFGRLPQLRLGNVASPRPRVTEPDG